MRALANTVAGHVLFLLMLEQIDTNILLLLAVEMKIWLQLRPVAGETIMPLPELI